MADGLNDARAMRVAEVMNDFRTTQHRIAQLQAPASGAEAQAVGYVLLRECHQEAQRLLSSNFPGLSGSPGNDEQTKRSLQRVLLDASSRRFRAHRIYLRAAAAMRWVQRRRQILANGSPNRSSAALLQVDNTLRTEMAAVTDSRVYNELRAKDQAAGNWLGEMADLNTLLAYVRTH